MRCLVRQGYGSGEVEQGLADALVPHARDPYASCGGIAEEARDEADRAKRVLGALLAALVEREVFTVEEAAEIAGVQGVRSAYPPGSYRARRLAELEMEGLTDDELREAVTVLLETAKRYRWGRLIIDAHNKAVEELRRRAE